MTGFEPESFGIESNRAVKCATTTAQIWLDFEVSFEAQRECALT